MIKNCLYCFSPLGAYGKCPRCGLDNTTFIPQPHHLPPETILHGRYIVGRSLGEGGFGITYAGYDLVLTRRIAIKEYYPDGTVWRDPTQSLDVNCLASQESKDIFEVGRQKCIREAQSLAKLDDIPAIVRILDFFRENNTVYIIMEFVEGVTIKEYVRRLPQRMTMPQIVTLLTPVADALEVVHRRGFVHRDISPDNIMINKNGHAKLLDFGAVKSVTSGGSATEHPVVKRGFSPLELYSTTGLIGAWTDVYALAATIYYLLTCSVLAEPTERLVKDEAAKRLEGMCNPAQHAAMMQALAVRSQERTASVAAFFDGLRRDTPNNRNQPTAHSDSGSSKKMTPLIIVVALAAVILLTVLLSSQSDSPERKTTESSVVTSTIPVETTAAPWDLDVQVVQTPSVTFTGTPEWENAYLKIYKIPGMQDETEQAREDLDMDLEVCFLNEDDSNDNRVLYQVSDQEDTAQCTPSEIGERLLSFVQNAIDYVNTSGDYTDQTCSDPYMMQIGGKWWMCYDIVFENGVVQTRANVYYDGKLHYINSYAEEGGTAKAREQIYRYIDTKWN